jgi:hypothetical protein
VVGADALTLAVEERRVPWLSVAGVAVAALVLLALVRVARRKLRSTSRPAAED